MTEFDEMKQLFTKLGIGYCVDKISEYECGSNRIVPQVTGDKVIRAAGAIFVFKNDKFTVVCFGDEQPEKEYRIKENERMTP